MSELSKIKKIFDDHFDGDPWIDVNLSGTLENISHAAAAEKVGNLNSIRQIVNHIISWRETLLNRLMEKSISVQDDNYISEIKNISDKSWKLTLKKLEKSQKDILTFLSKSNDSMLENISPASGYSYYELLLSILLHDTYHLGQIVLIKKLIGDNK